ncbi:MAG: hypothetical protein D6731_00685 [Planctomycetota bacterium]|nr:MAG: hypothetical protein D6731_00685 [Planctomycetota bacterium]
MDAERIDLGPRTVAVLRPVGVAPLPASAGSALGLHLLDVPVAASGAAVHDAARLLLGGACDALLSAFPADTGQAPLRTPQEQEGDPPLVAASAAADLATAVGAWAWAEAAGREFPALRIACEGGAEAILLALLEALGASPERLLCLEPGDDELPEDLDLLCAPGDAASAERARTRGTPLLPRVRGIHPLAASLARAAADRGAAPGLPALVRAARVLAERGHGLETDAALLAAACALDGRDPRRLTEAYACVASPLAAATGAARAASLDAECPPPRLLVVCEADAGVRSAARALARDGRARVDLLAVDPFPSDRSASAVSAAGPRGAEGAVRWAAAGSDAALAWLAEAVDDEFLDPGVCAALRRDPFAFAWRALACGAADAAAVVCSAAEEDALLEAARRAVPLGRIRRQVGVHFLATAQRAFVVADTAVARDPTAEDLAEAARQAREVARQCFGGADAVYFVAHASGPVPGDRLLERLARARDLVRASAPEEPVHGPVGAAEALAPPDRPRRGDRASSPRSESPGTAEAPRASSEGAKAAEEARGLPCVLVLPGRHAARAFACGVAAAGGGELVGPLFPSGPGPLLVLAPGSGEAAAEGALRLVLALRSAGPAAANAEPSSEVAADPLAGVAADPRSPAAAGVAAPDRGRNPAPAPSDPGPTASARPLIDLGLPRAESASRPSSSSPRPRIAFGPPREDGD